MSSDTLPKRIFIALILIIIFIGFSGCASVKHEWLPKYDPKLQNRSTQDVSKIEANILKLKF
jgi:uncharacterized protein YceK|tara:strand:+ start:2429 stop:2614 length:186 start_codon:yes stop_codon:yes gene_type:complete